MYGENKQNTLGRLLQEIVAQLGDITALDWVGTSSEFNSCLPADINSYQAPPYTVPSLSEGEMQTSVSLLRDAGAAELASRLYHKLESLSPARFAHRSLRLPCITFHVTEVRQRRCEDYEAYFTYDIKADGLHDLQITTEDKLLQFSPARPTRQSFLLIRPWDRRLLELPDFADDTPSVDDLTPPESPVQDSPCGSSAGQGLVDPESGERALCLVVRLGQLFSAFLLARQRGGEYKRIASDHDIIAQVKDVASGRDMDVRTLEIL